MFLAKIHGFLTATTKHPSLAGARFLIGRRLEADGAESGDPLVIVDPLGIDKGTVALISTDGDAIRAVCGNNSPARLSVMGIVSSTTSPGPSSRGEIRGPEGERA